MQQKINAATLKKNIGEKIKIYRKKRGLSQDELAERVNIEMKSLSRIEAGHNYPQCENLVAIACALDVAPWQLYFCEDKKTFKCMKSEIEQVLDTNDNAIVAIYQFLKANF